MRRRFEATLSTLEVLIVGMAQDIQVRRFPLTFPALGPDPVEVARAARHAYEQLAERRLARLDELVPDLRRCFDLFTDHVVSIGIAGKDGKGQDFSILGLTDHRHRLCITQISESLNFLLEDEDDLPAMLVPLFDYGRRAPDGPVLRIPLRTPPEDEPTTEDEPIRSMVRSPDRGFSHAIQRQADQDALAELFSRPRSGGGFVKIDGPNRYGARVHTPAFSWLDTDTGRYLVTTEADGTGVYTPIDAAGLTRVLHRHARALWTQVT
ncbi:ESX secretion-associated protein EspG [Amycolatopsis nigrescens]|uniref:ESX secretion-associated protein EspG n=1 Tax=Amycolatopsis nigrescens TaxID=381445 RepID=UPI0003759F82|nr:ESX secretion-associated protein EspG [Amycolatopsis nigrescens]